MDENFSARIDWIDVAKGFCIVFVVFGHVCHWYHTRYLADQTYFWHEFIEAFAALRMPLFLLISGFLASKRLNQSLSHNHARIFGLYALYMFWEFAFRCFAGAGDLAKNPASFQLSEWTFSTALAMVTPYTLWYIWALPVYCLLAWISQRLAGPKTILACATIISATTPFLTQAHGWQTGADEIIFAPVAANIIWFFLGVYGRDLWLSLIARARPAYFAISVLTFLSCYLIARYFDATPFVQVLLGPLALLAASQYLGSANLQSAPCRAFAFYGRSTLPIYVMHLFSLAVTNAAASIPPVNGFMLAHVSSLAVLAPLIVTPVLVAGCRAAGDLILASPFKVILDPLAVVDVVQETISRVKPGSPRRAPTL